MAFLMLLLAVSRASALHSAPQPAPVLPPGVCVQAFDRWMDGWRGENRKQVVILERATREDVTAWIVLKAKWVRIARRPANLVTAAENWTAFDAKHFLELGERLGIDEYTPKDPPPALGPNNFSKELRVIEMGERILKGKALPINSRSKQIEELTLRSQRLAVQPWLVSVKAGQIGVPGVTGVCTAVVGGVPVVRFSWIDRSAFLPTPLPKAQMQEKTIRLIGCKVGLKVGDPVPLQEPVFIHSGTTIDLDGKKVRLLDAHVVSVADILREAGRQFHVVDLDRPLNPF